jgi:hypothetical protein
MKTITATSHRPLQPAFISNTATIFGSIANRDRSPDSSINVSSRLIPMRGLLFAATLGLLSQLPAADLEIVARNLDNPRGLDFAPNGALYIAEGGRGGDGPVVEGPEGPVRFGLSGSITRVFRGTQERIVTGLPSLALSDGGAAAGPSSISFGGLGHAFVTFGFALEPSIRDTVFGPQAKDLGTLQQMNMNGQLTLVADLAAFEARDPDGNGPDSNPTGVLADRAGGAYATDAGGNTLLHIDAQGAISVVAIFPNRMVNPPQSPLLAPPQIPMQAVPTNVVRGPDGALYVCQLTGFPFPIGFARIYRVVPGSAPTVYATGFTNIIDLEFDSQGNLYVLEIDTNGLLAPEPIGRLARLKAGSTTIETIASAGLVMPGGMAIGPDDAIYISNFSVSAGGGQVVRVKPQSQSEVASVR